MLLSSTPGDARGACPIQTEPFDGDDGFLDLCTFLLQFRDHFQNVHFGSIAQRGGPVKRQSGPCPKYSLTSQSLDVIFSNT
jgi:hypothetical protein